MNRSKKIAEHATIQSFLNCYLRETENYEEVELNINNETQKVVRSRLTHQHVDLFIPVRYWSDTQRHLFSFPIYYSIKGEKIFTPLDYVTLVSMITKELLLENGRNDSEDELMFRVILSFRNIERYVTYQLQNEYKLQQKDFDFIDAEQSLIFGHLLHPTPKSRQGISEEEETVFSPELKGKFKLHYFRAHNSIIKQDSNLQKSTADLIKEEVRNDQTISESFKQNYCQNDNYSLVPAHPFQVRHLLKKDDVQSYIAKGLLEHLGPQGREFTATSSVRTVYNEESNFMFKFSLYLKITNSLRVNKYWELDRGVEVDRLLKSTIGKELQEKHNNFHIIRDPAYITIKGEEEESGFEVVLRENSFKHLNKKHTSLIAGLGQDQITGKQNRLGVVIHDLAEKEGRSTEEVSVDWFKRYLDISLQPIMWLYHQYGIALEAHQQNSVVQLRGGYPVKFYYRDNQGYYYSKSYVDKLKKHIPNISEKSDTICTDEIAEERLRYYFFFNHLFGLINAFGTARLINEEKLLQLLRSELKEIKGRVNQSHLIESLLYQEKLPCKANLLTRLYDMDELAGSLETQSVYVEINNPLKEGVESIGS